MTTSFELRPRRDRELAQAVRERDHLEDQLSKSRRFTALVGALGFIAGMVFQFIISMPPVWLGAL